MLKKILLPIEKAQHPLLLIVSPVIAGSLVVLHPISAWFFLLLLALTLKAAPSCISKLHLTLLLLLLALCGAISIKHCDATDLKTPLSGQGCLKIQKISPISSFFRQGFIIEALCISFIDDTEHHYKNIPCRFFAAKPLSTSSLWHVKGTLTSTGSLRYRLQLEKKSTPVEGAPIQSAVLKRFEWKQKIKRWIKRKPYPPLVRHFYTTILTGDIEDPSLRFHFNTLGLGHILVISGLHFGLLAVALRSILYRLASYVGDIAIIILLFAYFFFLGFSSSICRAALMTALVVVAPYLRRQGQGLNILALCLLVEWIIDPLIITYPSCQLTFLATAGIFFFYHPILLWIDPISPKRPSLVIRSFSSFEKGSYFLLQSIKKAAALNLAVFLTTTPLIVFIFHTYPLLSILYNLLLTPLVFLGLYGACLGLIIPFFAKIAASFMHVILSLIETPLLSWQMSLDLPSFSKSLFLTIYCIPILLAFYLHDREAVPFASLFLFPLRIKKHLQKEGKFRN